MILICWCERKLANEVELEEKVERFSMKLKKTIFGVTTTLLLGVMGASLASAAVANPAPYPIIDEWQYGTKSNGVTDYSYYYVSSAGYGSIARLRSKNIGTPIVASDTQNYGWAIAEKNRAWNDGNGFTKIWDYYRF